MKKLLALLFTAGVTLCMAATAGAQELKVTVPFDFVVAGKTLPAADYTITRPLVNDTNGIAFLAQGNGTLARASEIDYTVTGSKLIFAKVGDEYFLRDVVTEKGKLHFPESRKQVKLAQSADEQTVTILAGS